MATDLQSDSNAFERDKVCYEQNFEQFRSMNQIMWQVPLLAMTITGGLWYAAFTDIQGMQRPLLLLSTVLNFALIAVLWRVRLVMEAYLDKLRAFNPGACATPPNKGLFQQKYTVVVAFTAALLLAGVGSAVGVFSLDLLQFKWPK